MAAKKKAAASRGQAVTSVTRHQEEYDQAVSQLAGAIDLLHKGKYAESQAGLDKIIGAYPEEPELVDRARSYHRICTRRMAEAPAPPQTAEEFYYQAVLQSNSGDLEDAIKMFDRALEGEPGSARVLYGRASAWALKGNAEAAVGDLRQAIAVDPQVRFQALNDADFEKIREEPSFIDIIEPTPAGA